MHALSTDTNGTMRLLITTTPQYLYNTGKDITKGYSDVTHTDRHSCHLAPTIAEHHSEACIMTPTVFQEAFFDVKPGPLTSE